LPTNDAAVVDTAPMVASAAAASVVGSAAEVEVRFAPPDAEVGAATVAAGLVGVGVDSFLSPPQAVISSVAHKTSAPTERPLTRGCLKRG